MHLLVCSVNLGFTLLAQDIAQLVQMAVFPALIILYVINAYKATFYQVVVAHLVWLRWSVVKFALLLVFAQLVCKVTICQQMFVFLVRLRWMDVINVVLRLPVYRAKKGIISYLQIAWPANQLCQVVFTVTTLLTVFNVTGDILYHQVHARSVLIQTASTVLPLRVYPVLVDIL